MMSAIHDLNQLDVDLELLFKGLPSCKTFSDIVLKTGTVKSTFTSLILKVMDMDKVTSEVFFSHFIGKRNDLFYLMDMIRGHVVKLKPEEDPWPHAVCQLEIDNFFQNMEIIQKTLQDRCDLTSPRPSIYRSNEATEEVMNVPTMAEAPIRALAEETLEVLRSIEDVVDVMNSSLFKGSEELSSPTPTGTRNNSLHSTLKETNGLANELLKILNEMSAKL